MNHSQHLPTPRQAKSLFCLLVTKNVLKTKQNHELTEVKKKRTNIQFAWLIFDFETLAKKVLKELVVTYNDETKQVVNV